MKRTLKIILIIIVCAFVFALVYVASIRTVQDIYSDTRHEENVIEEPSRAVESFVDTDTSEEPVDTVEVEEEVVETTETLLGSDFTLYHYAPTGNATASGRMPVAGITVAVDPNYIKLGTWLRIEIPDGNGGYTVYQQKVRADDTGGNIKGHTLDIFVRSTSEALQCGVIKNARVYIIEE